jgi:hypothetical protein
MGSAYDKSVLFATLKCPLSTILEVKKAGLWESPASIFIGPSALALGEEA